MTNKHIKINIRDIPDNMDFSDYPDDTEFIIQDTEPHYILEPFGVIPPNDPGYENALTLEQAKQKISL